MADEGDVLAAASARATALGSGNDVALRALLHERFVWTSHTGERFDLDGYLRSNVGGGNRWSGQQLTNPEVTVVRDTAVLRCDVTDDVDTGRGREAYRMPVTQIWTRDAGLWVCLGGHAGPVWNESRQHSARQ